MSSPSTKDLNKLGIFSKRLSQVHVKSLESYPFIFFNDLVEAKIDYDVEQAKEGYSYVSYDLTLSKDPDLLTKRFEGLQTAIRALFWKEIELKLSINGKEYKYE